MANITKKQSDIDSFECSECGFSSSRWSGKCPQCDKWNSMVGVSSKSDDNSDLSSDQLKTRVKTLDQIDSKDCKRLVSGIDEWDRVLGGGIVEGSVTLIAGIPGIGKSTLLLQVAVNMANKGHKVLYVSAEESLRQIKLRSERVGSSKNIYLICESQLENILAFGLELKPEIIIVDSIQVINSKRFGALAGGLNQIKECSFEFTRFAKKNSVAIFIVGHVTKEGVISGPKVLEHIVDTVVYFEGEDKTNLRMIKAQKNRFGPTEELGLFEMTPKGLVEVKNPSALFLSDMRSGLAGAVVTSLCEGTRVFFIEIQSLAVRTNLDYPKRVFNCIDINRAGIILAVLEKRSSLKLWQNDIFVNAAGGIKAYDVAVDLAVAVSIISSLKEKPIAKDICIFGEIGLGGEIRAVNNSLQRVREAMKLGFKKCIIPKQNIEQVKDVKGIDVVTVESVNEVLELVF